MQTKSAATLRLPDLSASSLHILAMGLMLLDHLWATIVPGQDWMTCAGRLAYPIFAFLLAEGYAHTSSFRRYASRLLFWAVVSEIPFNLMYSSQAIYPYHQNVLWTLLIALCAMRLADLVREKLPVWLGLPAALGIGGAAALLATLAMIPINLVVLRLELGLMPDAVMAMMIPAILPFNLLKGVLNSAIYFVAGRPLGRVMARYQQSGGNRHE